jgi:ABC-type dipeptide/oligopeptide/nickel transport system ATPase component
MTPSATTAALLEVSDLKVSFAGPAGRRLEILRGISFSLDRQSTIGIVGESGSGKSVMALSLLRLIPKPPLQQMTGSVLFQGQDLMTLSKAKLRGVRGKQVGFVFQEPMTALNPVMSIGRQIVEMICTHEQLGRRAAWQRGVDLLHEVRIPSPELRMTSFPHELSGGMRQRAMIAMALSCSPSLLIADEPTTALDVTIQAQILELMKELQRQRRMSIIFITHDLGVIAEIADQIVVIQDGAVVEQGSSESVFQEPRHQYTRKLLSLRSYGSGHGAG